MADLPKPKDAAERKADRAAHEAQEGKSAAAARDVNDFRQHATADQWKEFSARFSQDNQAYADKHHGHGFPNVSITEGGTEIDITLRQGKNGHKTEKFTPPEPGESQDEPGTKANRAEKSKPGGGTQERGADDQGDNIRGKKNGHEGDHGSQGDQTRGTQRGCGDSEDLDDPRGKYVDEKNAGKTVTDEEDGTKYTYDSKGRLKQTVAEGPDGRAVRKYDANGVMSEKSVRNKTEGTNTNSFYDEEGKRTREVRTEKNGDKTTTSYGENGEDVESKVKVGKDGKITVFDPQDPDNENNTAKTFDPKNIPVGPDGQRRVDLPDGGKLSIGRNGDISYDRDGDGKNVMKFDKNGTLKSSHRETNDENGSTDDLQYNADGSPRSHRSEYTDPNGHRHVENEQFDSNGNPVSRSEVDKDTGQAKISSYDADGNLKSTVEIDPKDKTITYTNADGTKVRVPMHGQPGEEGEFDGVSWKYDKNGNIQIDHAGPNGKPDETLRFNRNGVMTSREAYGPNGETRSDSFGGEVNRDRREVQGELKESTQAEPDGSTTVIRSDGSSTPYSKDQTAQANDLMHRKPHKITPEQVQALKDWMHGQDPPRAPKTLAEWLEALNPQQPQDSQN